MKINWLRRLAVVALIPIAIGVFVTLMGTRHQTPQPIAEAPTPQPIASEPVVPKRTNSDVRSLPYILRSTTMSEDERAQLEKKFNEKLKPAIAKWCKAYEGRIGFQPEQLEFRMFADRFGKDSAFFLYSFVIDGTTIAVQESNGRFVVNYLNAPEAKQLMNLPSGDTPPVLQSSVTRQDVIKLVKADCGVDFQPSDLIMHPTGAGSALNGGVIVRIGPLDGDPNNTLCKLAFVFGPDGKLISYERAPYF